ncbi:3-phenylpropionate/cinnamic acid dioxygenase subunit beta [Candidatus Poriferisodalis sp.]|uniref:3-phenylpropionate/cinnamic acid dioxygenase subunit beta n=1 Tax=Candidatus Poriferisodalis sp. TaxID=3101277 RepID=UPI003C70109E
MSLQRARAPLPYSDSRHQSAAQFLVEEAHLLDSADFEGWLELMDPQIRYRMPVRVTAVKAADEADLQTMDHFDEDWFSLSKRVQRFGTDYAWTEDPQSRIRHHISNVRTFEGDGDELIVESAVLLYRSRGDRTAPSLLSAGRTDVLIPTPDGMRLRSRDIQIDESVLRTQNLAIFL